MSYEGEIRARSHDELVNALFVISRRLREEADRREWCADYDDFVELTNNAAGMIALEPRLPPSKRILIRFGFDVDCDYSTPSSLEARRWICNQAGEYAGSVANFDFRAEVVES
jgi:hypothetical protein